MGYSASDIISILFRVVRNFAGMNEYLKLEYIKVGGSGVGGGGWWWWCAACVQGHSHLKRCGTGA